jgi:putative membrane protein
MPEYAMRALLFALAVVSAPALAQKMDNNDAAAMKQLAQSNLNEIAAGKAAVSKAESPQVKSFGQKMVDDHSKMLEDLRTLAKAKGVVLPESASAKDMAQMKMIERKSGAEFDREYMQHMVKDHEKDLKDSEALSAKAKDAEFRTAVQKAHGKIKEHYDMAQRLAQGAAAGSSK